MPMENVTISRNPLGGWGKIRLLGRIQMSSRICR